MTNVPYVDIHCEMLFASGIFPGMYATAGPDTPSHTHAPVRRTSPSRACMRTSVGVFDRTRSTHPDTLFPQRSNVARNARPKSEHRGPAGAWSHLEARVPHQRARVASIRPTATRMLPGLRLKADQDADAFGRLPRPSLRRHRGMRRPPYIWGRSIWPFQ